MLLAALLMLAPMTDSPKTFEQLVPPDSRVELVAGGFTFIEGPAWLDGALVFSDIPNSRIHRYDRGRATVFREPSHKANGNFTDPQGRLVTCEHESRVVSRTEDGQRTVVADNWDGKKFNSPNDVVVRRDGAIFFTDPPHGLPGDRRAELMEYGGAYVFRIDPDGAVTPVATDFGRPNGLAFTADEKTLYVGDDKEKHIRKFAVADDGTLTGGEVFATIEPGVPDGLRVDTDGNVWTTAGDGVQIFAPDGTKLGVVECPETPANCLLAGDDGRTLFMTARTGLYAVRVNAADAGRK